jgi:membrane protein YdbS with pleckstrin-like domain
VSEFQFEVHPNLFHALFPEWIKRFFIAVMAVIPVYLLIRYLDMAGMYQTVHWRVVLVLVLFCLLFPGAKIKIKAILLHRTKYKFYDTHVVIERRIVHAKRHSVPYGQIVKITNDLTPWDRILNAADIILHTSDDRQEFVLKSIKDPDLIEEKIYRLLKKGAGGQHKPQSTTSHDSPGIEIIDISE